jgi:hypothetical protein
MKLGTESRKIKIQVSDNHPYHVLSSEPYIVAGILACWYVILSFLLCALLTYFRWNAAFMVVIQMRMTGFLPSNKTLVESVRRSVLASTSSA